MSGMGYRKIEEVTCSDHDNVNHPAHYTSGKVETIEIIEDAVKHATSPTIAFLQGNAIKYLMRMWLKNDPKEDAKKARWYIDRLIEKL